MNMENKNSIAAIAADFQAILNNELESIIKKAVVAYIGGRKDSFAISSSERELICENAWAQVVVKRESYSPGKAKFRTWAVKVAVNKAKDELNKLYHDASHWSFTETLKEDPETENAANTNDDKVSSLNAHGHVEDCTHRQYWHDAFESLKRIVSTYGGRDREVAEMLIAERTKKEIMAKTQMTGGNFDVQKHRLLKKMRSDLLKAGYSL